MPAAHIGHDRQDVHDEENMLVAVHGNTSISMHQTANCTLPHILQSTVGCVLHENQMHPYHLQPVHGLQPQGSDSSLQFCHWLLHNIMDEPDF
jgi:hypothetical protein